MSEVHHMLWVKLTNVSQKYGRAAATGATTTEQARMEVRSPGAGEPHKATERSHLMPVGPEDQTGLER